LGGGILTGKYHPDGSGPAGSRFASVEPDNEWRKAFVNDRNFQIAAAVTDAARTLKTNAAAVALAWVLGRPGVSSVIIGPKSSAQLHENLAASELNLPAETQESLDRISRPWLGYP